MGFAMEEWEEHNFISKARHLKHVLMVSNHRTHDREKPNAEQGNQEATSMEFST